MSEFNRKNMLSILINLVQPVNCYLTLNETVGDYFLIILFSTNISIDITTCYQHGIDHCSMIEIYRS